MSIFADFPTLDTDLGSKKKASEAIKLVQIDLERAETDADKEVYSNLLLVRQEELHAREVHLSGQKAIRQTPEEFKETLKSVQKAKEAQIMAEQKAAEAQTEEKLEKVDKTNVFSVMNNASLFPTGTVDGVVTEVKANKAFARFRIQTGKNTFKRGLARGKTVADLQAALKSGVKVHLFGHNVEQAFRSDSGALVPYSSLMTMKVTEIVPEAV